MTEVNEIGQHKPAETGITQFSPFVNANDAEK